MNKAYFDTLARYSAWANTRLYDAVAMLPEGEFEKPRPAFFGSIKVTLNHVLNTSMVWAERIEGRPPRDKIVLDEVLHDRFDALREAQEAFDTRLIALIGELTEARVDGDLSFQTSIGPMAMPMTMVLAHLFNHGTHHRGQVHGMLSATSVPPPPLDILYFVREM